MSYKELAETLFNHTKRIGEAPGNPTIDPDSSPLEKGKRSQPKLEYLLEQWPDGKWYPDKHQPRFDADGLPSGNIVSCFHTLTKAWLQQGWDLKDIWSEGGPAFDAVQHTDGKLSEKSARVAKNSVQYMIRNLTDQALIPDKQAEGSKSDRTSGLFKFDVDSIPDIPGDASIAVASSKKRTLSVSTTPTKSTAKPKHAQKTISSTVPNTPKFATPTSRRSLRSSITEANAGFLFESLPPPTRRGPSSLAGDGNQTTLSDIASEAGKAFQRLNKRQRLDEYQPFNKDGLPKASGSGLGGLDRSLSLSTAAGNTGSLISGRHRTQSSDWISLPDRSVDADLSDFSSRADDDGIQHERSEFNLGVGETTINAGSLDFPTPSDLGLTATNLSRNEWLTASDIQACLLTCPVSSGWDRKYPGFPSMHADRKTLQPFRDSKKLGMDVVFTLNPCGSHWVVGHWDLERYKFTIYDPMDDVDSSHQVKEFMAGWLPTEPGTSIEFVDGVSNPFLTLRLVAEKSETDTYVEVPSAAGCHQLRHFLHCFRDSSVSRGWHSRFCRFRFTSTALPAGNLSTTAA